MPTNYLSNPSEEIKNRLDVVEVIGGYIRLQKAGRNWRANCPFHSEKTPSFMVTQERQMWHCFGCGEGGDIFKFVMKMEGLEFVDALRLLAQKAGVVLKKTDPKLHSDRQKYLEINQWAVRFFQKQLESKTGKEVVQYLKKRGVTTESIKEWQIGYAPDQFDGLIDFLRLKNYSPEDIEKVGLVIKKEGTTKYYDRFRNRIMFPIADQNAQVVGFTGRVFGEAPENMGKYVNTPQSATYDKSRLLYGLDRAKVQVRQDNTCVVVEGNMDALMAQQAGVKNTVASSGTALTQYQLKILKRYTENLILAFDMDPAGQTATKRGIDLALLEGFNIKITQMSEKDPADLIKVDPKAFKDALKDSKEIINYYFDSTFAKFDQTKVEDKREIAKVLLPVIAQIQNNVVQAHWLQDLAHRLNISEKSLTEAMRAIKQKTVGAQTEPFSRAIPINSRAHRLEERLIGLMCIMPQVSEIVGSVSQESFQNKDIAEIFSEFKKHCKTAKKEIDLKKIQSKLPEHLVPKLNQIIFQIDQQPPVDIQEEITLCLSEIKKKDLKNELEELGRKIEEAEKEKDRKKLKDLIEKFKTLSAQLT